MGYIVVKHNQSIWDLAAMVYGDSAGVKQLIIDNPKVLNFNDDVPVGARILISQAPINQAIVDYFAKKGIILSTAVKDYSNWVLDNGFWNDLGIWIDDATWND